MIKNCFSFFRLNVLPKSSYPAIQVATASPSFCWWGAHPVRGKPLDFCLLNPLEVRLQLSERHRDIAVDDHLFEQVTALALHVVSQADHVLKILLLWEEMSSASQTVLTFNRFVCPLTDQQADKYICTAKDH